MKKLLTLVAALALSAPLTAFAADLPQPPPPLPQAPAFVPPPVFTWTGFYIGANGGYGWGHMDDGTGDSLDPKGALAGGQIGFNYQMNQAVLGVEADGDWSGISFSNSTFTDLGGGVSNTINTSYKDEAFATLTARFGWAVDRILIYGKAGGAWAQEKISQSGSGVDVIGPQSGSVTASTSRWGWTVGAGAEYAVLDNVSLKAEYGFMDFGSKNLGTTVTNNNPADPLFPPEFNTSITSKLNVSVVKVGVNILFH